MRKLLCLGALLTTLSTAAAQFAVMPYGPTCGPSATGEVTPVGATYRFAFTVADCAPRVFVMNILGVGQQMTPINFGYPCYLLTDIAFSQIHQTDAVGGYTWSHAMPNGFRGEACVQFAEVTFTMDGSLVVRTSNGLHMTPL